MLLSTLLGESPASQPVRRLVRIAGLFGINDNQARVALSRMVARGEVAADDAGSYALAGRLLERAHRIGAARTASTGPFDGSWHVVVVTATGDGAATRRERRATLRAARLGELRDGTWLRPANVGLVLADDVAAATRRFRGLPDTDPVALAHDVFDLRGWARRSRHLCGVLADVEHDGLRSLATGFELSAEVLRHLQRDPLVPSELLGRDWPGHELRTRYERFDADYRVRLAEAHRAWAASSTS